MRQTIYVLHNRRYFAGHNPLGTIVVYRTRRNAEAGAKALVAKARRAGLIAPDELGAITRTSLDEDVLDHLEARGALRADGIERSSGLPDLVMGD